MDQPERVSLMGIVPGDSWSETECLLIKLIHKTGLRKVCSVLLIIKTLVTHKLQIPTHKKGRRVVHVLAGACFVDFRYTQLIQKRADFFLLIKLSAS